MREDITYAQNILEAISSALMQMYGLTIENLASKRRTIDYVNARAMAVLSYCELTGDSYGQAGEVFGRHRCTVYYICNQAKEFLKYDRKFAHDYKVFNDKINEQICVNSTISTGVL